MRHILRLSLAHFSEHRLRTILTLIGIAAGVTAIVATTILSDSVFQSFENLVAATAGDADLHVSNAGLGVPEELVEELRDVDGVVAASALVEGFVPLAEDRGKLLAIFGMDVLAEGAWRSHLPREAFHIPDELAFIANPDSIILTTAYAAATGLAIGSTLPVITPSGPTTLVVRGLIEDSELAGLFAGRIALMDLPASQLLLGKTTRVDRIDLFLSKDSDRSALADRTIELAAGRGRVREPMAHGQRSLKLLFTVRAMLAQAVVMSTIVGFLIIYHTMSVSIIQRQREIGLLRSLGASRATIFGWIGLEALLLGFLASVAGFFAAVALSRLALRLFGPITDAWIRLSPVPPSLSWMTATSSFAVGVGVTLIATLWAGERVLRQSIQSNQHALAPMGGATTRLTRRGGMAIVASTLLAALIVAPPPLSSFTPLLVYSTLALTLLFTVLGLASALPALWLGRLGVAVAKPRSGVSLLFASATLRRNPTAPTAVVTAMVVALGWTVGNASYMASVRGTWLDWVDREYPAGTILVATEGAITGITAPTFSEDIVSQIATMPGVRQAAGIRYVESELGDKPVVIVARDQTPDNFPGLQSPAPQAWNRFWSGHGVFLGENLARVAGLRPFDRITLNTHDGRTSFEILGIVADDLFGTDLGSIVISRSKYRTLWRDQTVARVNVDLVAGADIRATQEAINRRFAASHGLYAMNAMEHKRVFATLIDAVFAGTYGLVFVGFAVSFIAVVNFLLAMLVERRLWYQRLHILGAMSAHIRATILTEGGVLGLVGGIVGIAAAVGVSMIAIYRTIPMVNGWQFDYRLPLGPVLFGVFGTILLAVCAAAVPARLASHKRYLQETSEE